MNYRKLALELCPQARYMLLDGHHCIDDNYNDRYLAIRSRSRYMAWKEAYEFLKARKEASK